MQDDFRWYAKYPYDPRAGDILREISLNIDDFMTDDLRFLIDEAAKRIIDLINGKGSLLWENDYQEMIKFYLAVLIVRGSDNEYLYRAYADAEAKRAQSLLRNEDDEKIIELSKSLGIDVRKRGAAFLMKYRDFIEFTKGLSPVHWKLFNFRLESGYVKLNKRQVIRVLANVVKKRVYNIIRSIEVTPDFLSEYTIRVINQVNIRIDKEKETLLDKDISNYPPCIRKMIDDIPIGLSHPARFTLVTFLHKMGYSIEEIVDLFRRVPDFNLEKTRYQVEHILGLRGSRIEYEVPSCRKIKSYGMCIPDQICRGIRHPTTYVRKKRRVG